MARLMKLWKLDPSAPNVPGMAFYVDPALVVYVESVPQVIGSLAKTALVFHPPGAQKSNLVVLQDSPGRVAMLIEASFDPAVPMPEEQDAPPSAPLQLVTP